MQLTNGCDHYISNGYGINTPILSTGLINHYAANFREDVIKVNNIYLCRSCIMVCIGITASMISMLFFREVLSTFTADILLIVCTITIPLSFPKIYKRLPRMMRDILRFMIGISLILCVFMIFSKQWVTGITVLLILFIFWKLYMNERRGRKLKACNNCPELGKGEICSGFRIQAENIRQFEDEATDFLLNSGYVPDTIKGSKSRS